MAFPIFSPLQLPARQMTADTFRQIVFDAATWENKLLRESDRNAVPVLFTPGGIRALNDVDPGDDSFDADFLAESPTKYFGKKDTCLRLPRCVLTVDYMPATFFAQSTGDFVAGPIGSACAGNGILLGVVPGFVSTLDGLMGQYLCVLPALSWFSPDTFYAAVTADPNFIAGDVLLLVPSNASYGDDQVTSDVLTIASVSSRYARLRVVVFDPIIYFDDDTVDVDSTADAALFAAQAITQASGLGLDFISGGIADPHDSGAFELALEAQIRDFYGIP